MAKSDEARGPIASWMRRERLAHGWTDTDMTHELAKRGVHILPASYRGYEAGPRPPSSQVKQALEAVFGSPAPDTTKEAAEHQPDSLIAALYAQTEAINALVAAIRDPTLTRSLGDVIAVHLAAGTSQRVQRSVGEIEQDDDDSDETSDPQQVVGQGG